MIRVDCVHVQHPDAKLQLCGNIVFLVFERTGSGTGGLASARVMSSRPEELVDSQITKLCGPVAPSSWPEQR